MNSLIVSIIATYIPFSVSIVGVRSTDSSAAVIDLESYLSNGAALSFTLRYNSSFRGFFSIIFEKIWDSIISL